MVMVDAFFIFGAKYLAFIPLIIAGLFFIKQRQDKKREIFLVSLISVIFVGIIAFIAGHLFYNPRPFVIGHFTPLIPHAPDNGFPSDHTLLAAFVASVFTIYNKRLGIALWIIAVLVAISRVYVEVHHPIDVIGSIIISILGTYLGYLIYKYKKSKTI